MILVNWQQLDVKTAILYPESYYAKTHKIITKLLSFHKDEIWIGKMADSWLDPDRYFDPVLEKLYVRKASARER